MFYAARLHPNTKSAGNKPRRLCALPDQSSGQYLRMKPELCPHCGAEVPEKARVCPECGSDAETGWSEKASYDNLGIEYDDDFNYGEFIKREFEGKEEKHPGKWIWIVAGIVLIIA